MSGPRLRSTSQVHVSGPRLRSMSQVHVLGPRLRSTCQVHVSGPHLRSTCQVHVSGPRLRSTCQVHMSGPRLRSMSQVHISGPRLRSTCQVHISGPRLRSTSQVHISGPCLGSTSQVHVSGPCLRSTSQVHVSGPTKQFVRPRVRGRGPAPSPDLQCLSPADGVQVKRVGLVLYKALCGPRRHHVALRGNLVRYKYGFELIFTTRPQRRTGSEATSKLFAPRCEVGSATSTHGNQTEQSWNSAVVTITKLISLQHLELECRAHTELPHEARAKCLMLQGQS